MQKFIAFSWTTSVRSWQYLSGINNWGRQLAWFSEGGRMLVQWYINIWVYKLFSYSFSLERAYPWLSCTVCLLLSLLFHLACSHTCTEALSLTLYGQNESFLVTCSKVMDEACCLEELQIDCMRGLLLTIWSSEVFFLSLRRLSRMVTPVKGTRRLTMKFIIVQCVSKIFFASMGWSPTWRHIQIIHWGKKYSPESVSGHHMAWGSLLGRNRSHSVHCTVNFSPLWFWTGF